MVKFIMCVFYRWADKTANVTYRCAPGDITALTYRCAPADHQHDHVVKSRPLWLYHKGTQTLFYMSWLFTDSIEISGKNNQFTTNVIVCSHWQHNDQHVNRQLMCSDSAHILLCWQPIQVDLMVPMDEKSEDHQSYSSSTWWECEWN